MADVEWLIAGGLLALGLVLGLGIGLFISRKTGKVRDLQEQLQGSQSELKAYREQVVTQFSETARKFKTLNDAYADLHQQLAESASTLCGSAAGPLLEAPAGAEKLLTAETSGGPSTEPSTESSAEPSAEPSGEGEETAQNSEADSKADAETPAETVAQVDERPAEPTAEAAAEAAAEKADTTKTLEARDAEGGEDIRVPEPDRADRSGNDEPAQAQAPTEPRKYGANP